MENLKLDSGRICWEDMVMSIMISNRDKEKLLDNIEVGVRELAEKFINAGFDLLSSCQGHPPEECNYNYRVIKICVEEDSIDIIKKNIENINSIHCTNIRCSSGNDESPEERQKIIDYVGTKEYKHPLPVYITFGKYNECQENYGALLKNFDEYNWVEPQGENSCIQTK